MNKLKFILALALLVFFASSCPAQVIVTFAGTGVLGYSGDGGPATLANLKTASGVAVDRSGNVLITDQNGSCVRKVNAAGLISTVAGTGVTGYTGDGGPASAAQLNWPEGVTIDRSGNIFIADQFNNVIRMVSATTGNISTVAGNNSLLGYSGDGGRATSAALWHPSDVATDPAGNLIFADRDNSAIRKVDMATGIITTIAGDGTPGYSGDGGPATAARFNFPQGIATDSIGNIFIADFYNDRIRKIDTSGFVITVAGNGTSGFTGDSGPATNAELSHPSAVAVDNSGNLFLSDYNNARIRKVNVVTHVINTIAGNGTAAYCCDCHLATTAEIYNPEGVAVDASGNLYIADFSNSRVRKVTDSFACPTLKVTNETQCDVVEIFPNPCRGQFSVTVSDETGTTRLDVYSLIGINVYSAYIQCNKSDFDLGKLPAGVYMLQITTHKHCVFNKLVIDY